MTGKVQSQPSSPDDVLLGDSGVYDFNHVPRIQLVKPNYSSVIPDEALFDIGLLQTGQHLSNSGLAMNFQYMNAQQYMLPQPKEDSLELEDYVQGLNDRFELPTDQLLPMTPRCSFEQGMNRISLFILRLTFIFRNAPTHG
jgi:hypothetical protein